MIDGLLKTYGDPDYVAHSAVDLHLEKSPDLSTAYTCNVELMARLDAENQMLAQEMSRALAELQRSQKRTKYQFDLLKSDVQGFHQRQKAVGSSLKADLGQALSAPVLGQLKQLGEQRNKILEVQSLLNQAKESNGTPTDEVATVLKGVR